MSYSVSKFVHFLRYSVAFRSQPASAAWMSAVACITAYRMTTVALLQDSGVSIAICSIE